MKKIIAINLGSTSTKIVYYEDDKCVYSEELSHSLEEIKKYETVWEQIELRKQAILDFINEHNIDVNEIDAFTSRGGHTVPLVSGTYEISPLMLEQSASEKYGNHISDVGLKIASIMAKENNAKAFTVDTPVTDEFEPLARYSGLPEIPRRSSFHALNHKGVAKKYAKDNNKKYDELNLVVCHIGGGTSVAVHKKGQMVDGPNGLFGEGPFSTNRTGGLPVGDLIKMCFSGDFSYEDIKRKLNGVGGMAAYVNDNSFLSVYNKVIAGDKKCLEVIEAMAYQVAKEIAAMSSVVNGEVDAIIFTGGIARSEYMIDLISKRVGFIAPVHTYPGEFEMESLSVNTYHALNGEIEIKRLEDLISE